MSALGHAVLAALWLLGLIAAAPLLRGGPRLADRLRDAIVIGVAIPLVLGLLHLLYWPACWVVLGLCIAAAVAWRRDEAGFREPMPHLLLFTIAFVAWPQLVRPPLDGDTLSYHLPNAAAWIHAHSLWTTSTRYWWYPPASELFASAIALVSTPLAVGWSGVAALSLLGLRIYAWAREGAYLPTRLADLLAAATVAILPLALQAGSMQNDVWLAAFFIEILWSAPVDDVTVLRSAALCALLKPDGWIYAAIGLASSSAKARAWGAAAAALLVWAIHDAFLWRGAFIPPATTALAHLWRSTMLAHPLASLEYGFAAATRLAPFGFLLLLAAFASPKLARDSPIAKAGIAAALAALILPFGFANAQAQLAGGASLRYFAPAIASGALLIAPSLVAFASFALWLLLAATALESLGVLAIFFSDRLSLVAFSFAPTVAVVVAVARKLRLRYTLAIAAGCTIVVAVLLAGRTPSRFYADALAVHGHRSGIYAWIARAQPTRIAGWGLRIGAIAILSPGSTAMDVPDTDPCGHAQRANAVLVAVAEPTHSDSFNALRIHDAALCGRVLYRDPIAIAVMPQEVSP